MPQSLVRKGIWALGAVAVLITLLIAALPLVASTQIVQNRIAFEMSAWTGYRVEFAAAPEIEIWPTFRAIVRDVKFSDWQDDKHSPVIEAERIEIELSALAALSGDARFQGAKLLRPIVHVTPAGGLIYAPDLPASGRVANSIDAARAAVSANPTEPDVSALPEYDFGTVEFIDGQVVVTRTSGDQPVMTSLGGALRWPTLTREAALNATAIWRGESVSLEARLGQPLLLFAGGASSLSIALKAAPVTATYEGTANVSANSFFDGMISVESPSLRRMLEWSASDVVASSATGSFSLSGRAIGDARRVKVEDAQLALDGNPGNGLLDFTIGDGIPSVSGTLAFENLNLASFLFAFTPLSPGTATQPVTINPATIDRLDLDLRLSATRASVGAIALSDVAATLQAKGDVTDFDLSDASTFGGRVQAGVRYDRARDNGFLEVSLMATDVEAGTVIAAANATGIVPSGRATFSVMLKGAGRDWDSFMQAAQGTISASFGPGTVSGFDLGAFLTRIDDGGFFALSEIPGGTLNVERAELKANVGNGLARIEKADVTTPDRIVKMIGIVPHVGRGLALSGAVVPKEAAEGEVQPLARFFVGGAWSAPFVSPAFIPSAVLPTAAN